MIIPTSGTGVQSLPTEAVISVDTEYVGTHTLTIQVATRLDAQTLAVQVYRSLAIPDLPHDFDLERYISIAQGRYGRFCTQVIVRPVKLLSSDLSPARMWRDLSDNEELTILSRYAGQERIACFLAPEECSNSGVPPNVEQDYRNRRWIIPAFELTLVGHYLRADFGRIHGRDFLWGLKNPYWSDLSKIVMRSRKLLQFVQQDKWRTNTKPTLEYCFAGQDMY